MNTKFKIYSLFLLLFVINSSWAQETNNDRMRRDIEVAKNILGTLLNQSAGQFPSSDMVDGSYIEGHGVLFTISGNIFSNVYFSKDVLVPTYTGDGTNVYRLGKTSDKRLNLDSLNNANRTHARSVMKTFITDYAHLLSQLKADEKILLRYTLNNSNKWGSVIALTRSAGSPLNLESDKNASEKVFKELSAEVSKTALDEHKLGKLSKPQLEERIKFTEKVDSGKRDTDLELLSSIFNRLYQSDLSTTFRLIGNADYEKVEGLGAIFTMQYGYGNTDINGFFYSTAGTRVWSRNGIERAPEMSESDWKEIGTKKYPEFLKEFKANMIEYGRTVKSLATNELIMFKLNLGFCGDCGVPQTVELSVKKSVLEDYDKNKINLEQAIEKISVKETPKRD